MLASSKTSTALRRLTVLKRGVRLFHPLIVFPDLHARRAAMAWARLQSQSFRQAVLGNCLKYVVAVESPPPSFPPRCWCLSHTARRGDRYVTDTNTHFFSHLRTTLGLGLRNYNENRHKIKVLRRHSMRAFVYMANRSRAIMWSY